MGTSAGALNVAYLGDHGMTADALHDPTRLWRGVRRSDVFPVDPLRAVLALTGRRPSLCSSAALRRLIANNVRYRRLQDANVPLHLITTSVLTGVQVCLSTGDTVSVVLASTALPAIFPAVQIDGVMLCDGGMAATVASSLKISVVVDRRRAPWLLPYQCPVAAAGSPCRSPRRWVFSWTGYTETAR